MTTLFKYLKREFAQALLRDGQFRIGILSEYRNTEQHGLEVGDPIEGVKVVYEDAPMIDYRKPETVPEFMKHFITVPPGPAGLIFENIGFQQEIESPEFYIYSMTSQCDLNAMSVLGYDACVKITNPVAFVRALSDELVRLGLVKRVALNQCIYAEKRTHHTQPTPYHPAILKDPRYSYQCEVRAVWEPQYGPIAPVVLICPSAAEFCEQWEINP